MLVAWSLFTTWLVFNLADIVISWMAAQFGAIEVGLLYQISGSWQGLTSNKMMLALLIGGVLVYAKRNDLLALLNVGIAGLCIYNGWVFAQQVGG